MLKPRSEPVARFDHVVFACHSDQALRMLADPTPTERAVLAEFPYGRNIAVLHTDHRVLPQRRRAWASWNYLTLTDSMFELSVSQEGARHE